MTGIVNIVLAFFPAGVSQQTSRLAEAAEGFPPALSRVYEYSTGGQRPR